MAYTFSTDQTSVIEARNQNVLVSAAAGSGKTSVLTERIVGRVLDEKHPIDIDRVLVVTFTKAAAGEMRERIEARLLDKLSENPENSHLQKQATLIHRAKITTIDSFCLDIVRDNFHRIDLDPSFRTAGEGEKALLMQDVLKELLKDSYASNDEDFYRLVDCYANKDNDGTIEESILKLYNFSMSYPWPEKWLDARKKDYSFESIDKFLASDMVNTSFETAERVLQNADSILKELEAICNLCPGDSAYKVAVSCDRQKIDTLITAVQGRDFDTLAGVLPQPYQRLTAKKDAMTDEEHQIIKSGRDRYKAMLADLEAYFPCPLELCYEDVKGTAKTVNKLVDLTREFIERFDKAKRERGLIDFSDMEHMAIRILINDYRDDGSYEITDVAKGYRDFFEEVMVDEYQDSNLVQEIIIQSVSKENESGGFNRFMVGDVKQSIYRFRLARPQIFIDKTKRYVKDASSKDRLINLKKNFRSRKAVIDSVNCVFENVMTQETSGMEYDDDAKLYLGADYPEDTEDNVSELVMLETDENADGYRTLEANYIASRIKSLLADFKVLDKGTKELRPVRYKDIAVLARSTSKCSTYLKDAFESCNIPYHMEDTGAFYDTREVKDVLEFLRIINNPLDDISLYSALTSSFGGLSDEECARIKVNASGEDYYLWDKLQTFFKDHPEDEKISRFLQLVEKYRGLVSYVPISELLGKLLEETGYKHIVAALPDGRQRLANVEMLVTKAYEYSKTSFHGLFHFLRYVELIKKLDKDEGEASIFDENSDTVRIMTIHKSKGLEFPVCFITGMEDAFSTQDLKNAFISDIDAGIGAQFIDPVKRIRRNTLKRNQIGAKIIHENVGEEIRILYVAMTRAKEKLIMVSAKKDIDKWLDSSVTSVKSYLDCVHDAVVENPQTIKFLRVTEGDIDVADVSRIVKSGSRKCDLEAAVLNVDEDSAGFLNNRFSFDYPYANLEKLYTKTTVSEIKMAGMKSEDDGASHPFEETEKEQYVPSFAGGDIAVKGTERGTAYHNLLKMLDFKPFANLRTYDEKRTEFERQRQEIVSSNKMTAEDTGKVFEGKILAFLKTPLAERMAGADLRGELFKEQPFVLGVSADKVNPEFPADETVLIQGVIDVFFIEDGKVTIADYKTDRVEKGDELIKRYKSQLDYYGEAVKQLTGLEVDSKLIYSFGLNETFVVQ